MPLPQPISHAGEGSDLLRWSTGKRVLRTSLQKPLLTALAILLAIAAAAYGSVWMYTARSGPKVELGFNNIHTSKYDRRMHSQSVEDVEEASPAERAGLRPGDRITGVNGQALEADIASTEAYLRGRPGDAVDLTIERDGEPKPLILHGVFRAVTPARTSEGRAKTSALQIMGLYPIPFLLVAFAVLFLRLEDRNAWLLALLFCAFLGPPSLSNPFAIPASLRTFAFAARAVFLGMLCPLFYFFFAVFPARSPLDRLFPWLKWAGLTRAS